MLLPEKRYVMCGALDLLLPLRILLQAGEFTFHPSCHAVEILQGVAIKRIYCANKEKSG